MYNLLKFDQSQICEVLDRILLKLSQCIYVICLKEEDKYANLRKIRKETATKRILYLATFFFEDLLATFSASDLQFQ